MEHFILIQGNRKSRRLHQQLISKNTQGGYRATRDEMESLTSGIKAPFLTYVMSTLASRGTSANNQLFIFSSLLKHKGLSNSGLDIMARLNLACSDRSFRREEEALLLREQSSIR